MASSSNSCGTSVIRPLGRSTELRAQTVPCNFQWRFSDVLLPTNHLLHTRLSTESVMWLLQEEHWKYVSTSQPSLPSFVLGSSRTLILVPDAIPVADASYYASCSNMVIEHYQALVDRGWRRSGHTYYKPDLTRSCCPHYTIRLDAGKFKASKSQRQAMNRWNGHVLGAEYLSKAAKLCPRSREEKQRRRTIFDLEASVHASEYANLERPVNPRTKERIEPAHKFEINLESDSFSEEKWNVFLAYQTTIHKERESRWSHYSFKRFLCSGLDPKIIKSKGITRKLGSYHLCYRLDGKLIAVAVLDLLPHGVSSVYLL
jgi:arginyl-tRNA--protein-N-Asp/Glu arginylyltransferase